jgi:hypothetical protein
MVAMFLRLSVSDGEHEGFVVCGAVHVREHRPAEPGGQ